MKIFYRTSIALIFIYLTYGLFVSQYQLNVLPHQLIYENPTNFYDYKGVINIHSNFANGSGSYQEIIRAAQEAELDFIYITDLNIFDPPKELEGYHDDLLVFMGGEYSLVNSRLLNLNAQTTSHLQGMGVTPTLIRDLITKENNKRKEGLFVLVHPLMSGYEWSGNFPIGLDGLEIINLKYIWQDSWLNKRASFLWALFIYPFNSELALLKLFTEFSHELEYWDNINNNRKTLAFAGTSAEAKVVLNTFHFPTYYSLFKIVRNHVLIKSELTGNKNEDRQKIAKAINNGQFYMSIDLLAESKGFLAVIEDKQKKQYPLGSELIWRKELDLLIQLPTKPFVPFEIIIYKNGEKIMVSNSVNTRFRIHSPGVYRAVVRVIPTFPLPDGRRWLPWIFTNSFYVK